MTDTIRTPKFESGPPHIPVDDFAERSNEHYRKLLSRNPSEPEIQSFLEKHPWLVPGYSTPSVKSGHCPLHCSLIAQPKLPGQDLYIPDFVWIATHSDTFFPTLIEIERPGKRIFNKDGTPSADFTRARNQLNQWRTWFESPENVLLFLDLYGIPDYWRRHRSMRLHMILIYGRRSEFEGFANLTRQRGTLLSGEDEELMSFDRLEADTSMRDAITVKADGHGKYRAVWIPPLFRTGTVMADMLLNIEGIPEAIDQNPAISDDRKSFLRHRIAYWREWKSAPSSKMFVPQHWE